MKKIVFYLRFLFMFFLLIEVPFLPSTIWGKEYISIVSPEDQISDIDVYLALTDIEASLGHAAKCYKLYDKVMEYVEDREALSLKLADQMNIWGDFYRVEAIYKAYLKHHPNDTKSYYKLADVLKNSQRYEEAEGIYRMLLLIENESDKAMFKLAEIQLSQKEIDLAFLTIDKLLSNLEHQFTSYNDQNVKEEISQKIRSAQKLKAETLYNLKHYEEALAVCKKLEPFIDPDDAKDLILMGKIYVRIDQKDKSRDIFIRAYQISPDDPETQYYYLGEKEATSRKFIEKLLKDKKISPMILFKWANIYSINGFSKIAVQLYEKALSKDPECFPVRLGLAEVLGIDHQYERSLDSFQKLSKEFPKNSKILISWGRVLGWSGQYQKSIELYKEILKQNDIDPVPRKEMARTAIWGKEIDHAMKFYESFWSVPVDKDLLSSLHSITGEIKNRKIEEIYQHIYKENQKGSIFSGYEGFIIKLNELKADIQPESFRKLEDIAASCFPKYKIQKGAYLESQAKWKAYNKRYAQAIDYYEKLIDFCPGNQEAIFDYAQVQCALGLCNQEIKTYAKLLDIDPLHSLANIAMEEKKIKSHVAINGSYSFWKEKGRGDLSQISRHKTDLSVDVPVLCRYDFYLTGHNWIEKPEGANYSYKADGYTIGIRGVVNPYIKGNVSFTQKNYDQKEFGIKDTGKANIIFNLKDIMQLGFGFERTDELYNYFSLKQGIQADHLWIDGSVPINRRLELTGMAKFLKYSDENEGKHYTISGGYNFSDHPKIFKVILSGEYRDTKNENIFHYQDNTLTDITHPYWTPHNYFGTGLTFEWYHDISKFLFCGSELHYYDLKLSFGTNSEQNPSVAIEGDYHFEFYKHWMLSLKGMIHNSMEWDAVGLWGNISYRF